MLVPPPTSASGAAFQAAQAAQRGRRPYARGQGLGGEGDEPNGLPGGGPLGLREPLAPPPSAITSCAEAAVDRMLVGATPGVAEVRLGVAAGPLAGVEVRLVMAPQGIEIAFLAADAGTRRMLAGVAAELQRRLEQRGRRNARVEVTDRFPRAPAGAPR